MQFFQEKKQGKGSAEVLVVDLSFSVCSSNFCLSAVYKYMSDFYIVNEWCWHFLPDGNAFIIKKPETAQRQNTKTIANDRSQFVALR